MGVILCFIGFCWIVIRNTAVDDDLSIVAGGATRGGDGGRHLGAGGGGGEYQQQRQRGAGQGRTQAHTPRHAGVPPASLAIVGP